MVDELAETAIRSISDSADLTQTASMLQMVTASFGMTIMCDIAPAGEEDLVDDSDIELF